jgi:hypothetical protein
MPISGSWTGSWDQIHSPGAFHFSLVAWPSLPKKAFRCPSVRSVWSAQMGTNWFALVSGCSFCGTGVL